MKILFIRHGEPDYSICDERGFKGQGRDMAPLTDLGIKQAELVSKDKNLIGSEIIVSSPYTRALQTAAIISKNTAIDLLVEMDLHEFIPDKTFNYKGETEAHLLHKDFWDCRGTYPYGETRKWETIDEIITRVIPVIEKYKHYDRIIVVAHGGVIRRFIGLADIEYCKVYEFDYDSNFKCHGWV